MPPFERERYLLPEFPPTPHLPFQPNTGRGDVIASPEEARIIFSAPRVTVEEKMDGACVGETYDGDQPVVRNRDHILTKGYVARTRAKKQFASLWNHAYQNADRHKALHRLVGTHVSVYAEWLVMPHGTRYDRRRTKACPFVSFDLYLPEVGRYLDPLLSRYYLQEVGFARPDLLAAHVCSYEHLAALACEPSSWSEDDLREGVYVKVGDGQYLTHRYKMVRPGFVPGRYFE